MELFILTTKKYFREGSTLSSALWKKKIAIHYAFNLFITPSLFVLKKKLKLSNIQ